ncbi:MAG: hypothetical protein QXY42_01960 [Candidatus Bathyarchaeia archaeon]
MSFIHPEELPLQGPRIVSSSNMGKGLAKAILKYLKGDEGLEGVAELIVELDRKAQKKDF